MGRTLGSGAVVAVLLLLGIAAGSGPVGAQDKCGDKGCVTLVEAQGLIDDIQVDHLLRVVRDADTSTSTVGVVIQLDSSGVVVSDTRFGELVGAVKSSRVPVSVWVGPSGAEASGGAAELLSVASNTGIANGSTVTPEPPRTTESGSESEPWGVTLSAKQAVADGIVARVSPTLGDHLVSLPFAPSKVVKKDGQQRREPLTVQRFVTLPLGSEVMHTAASPAVAYLAVVIGLALLLFEFFTAGVGVAGVVGALALILGGYGIGSLPVRGWAVVLLAVAFVAFAIDVQTGIPRFWTGAGLVMFIVATAFLFRDVPRPWLAQFVGVVGIAVTMVSGMPSMVRARFGTPTVGREQLIGRIGTVVSAINPEGVVRVDGAMWRARTHRLTPLDVDAAARVVAIDGLELEVEPEEGGAVDYRELRRRREGSVETAGGEDPAPTT